MCNSIPEPSLPEFWDHEGISAYKERQNNVLESCMNLRLFGVATRSELTREKSTMV